MAALASIKQSLLSAFRDFKVDGVPASGPSEPEKPAIRGALGQLVDLVASAGTTLVFGTVAEMAAHPEPQGGARAEVRADPLGDVPNGNGVYSFDASARAWVWISGLVPQAVGDALDALANTYAPLLSSQRIGKPADYTNGSTANASTYVFASPISADGRLETLGLWARNAGTIAIRRFNRSGNTFTQVGADLVKTVTAGLNSFSDLSWPVQAGEYLGFYGLNVVGFISTSDDFGGYYTGAGNVTTFTSATVAAGIALQVGFKVVGIDETSEGVADFIGASEATPVGLVVSIRGHIRRGADKFGFSGAVTLGAASTGTATAETTNLANTTLELAYFAASTGYAFLPAAGRLKRAHVSNLQIRRVSDNVLLTAGADYLVNTEHGAVGLPAAGTAIPISASYNWAQVRYDLIYVDPETRALGVIVGTAANRDAADRLPAIGNSKRLPLFMARVVGGAVSRLIPLWDVSGGVRRQVAASAEDRQRRNRRALRKTLGRLQSGAAMPLVGYGDSITALQSGPPSTTVANGPQRDRALSFLEAQGSDLTSAIPLFDFGDGAGQVHTKLGWNWALLAAMEEIYPGGAVTYYNMGIAGTTTQETGSNGLAPVRLAAAKGYAANGLVVLAFGMNEISGSYTEANTVALIQEFKSVGADVVVMGCPRPNPLLFGRTYAQWLFTNRALERAADYAGAAFCSTLAVSSDENLGVIGIDPLDGSASNLTNHPGLAELRAYGRALVSAVLD